MGREQAVNTGHG